MALKGGGELPKKMNRKRGGALYYNIITGNILMVDIKLVKLNGSGSNNGSVQKQLQNSKFRFS